MLLPLLSIWLLLRAPLPGAGRRQIFDLAWLCAAASARSLLFFVS